MRTHNIFFKVKYEKFPKLSLNICHLDILGIILRDGRGNSNSYSKRAISVQATEI